jgi:hypothetical protein
MDTFHIHHWWMASRKGTHMINTRIAIAVGTSVLWLAALFCLFLTAPAPAGADPNTFGADPNPFGGFSSSRQETAPADSPGEAIKRGLREGHSAWLPGLPAPTQPR